MSRVASVAVLAAALACATLGACSGESDRRPTVVLYTSVDEHLAAVVIAAFEAESGLRVKRLGDTEQTKTTGLVQRLLLETDRPRADVWWSSEAMGTIKLARLGVLTPYQLPPDSAFTDGWPSGLRGEYGSWYGFALRARVIAYNTDRVAQADAPTTLRELTQPRWNGRVGMARPQFGTTRGHMAAIVAAHGEDALQQWLLDMRRNGLRIYDGNSAAVSALARGEIDACLTDTDDVWAAQRNGWPVALTYETPDEPGSDVQGLPSAGPLVIPNTVGLVRSGPNPDRAAQLIEFLLSERAERLIALSDSHNVPIHTAAGAGLEQYVIPSPWRPNLIQAEAQTTAAMTICTRILGR
ncbi:MAG: extracellular solute-binding protein [Planctomycetes bacterium]|nr:extracellular solute-binding protein [Planctomycetota bacterium]